MKYYIAYIQGPNQAVPDKWGTPPTLCRRGWESPSGGDQQHGDA